MPSVSVEFDRSELKHLQKALDKGGLAVHQAPMQALFADGTKLILREARKRAPVRSGATVASLRNAYGATGKRPWGTGKVTMSTKQGAILNNGGRRKGGNWTKAGAASRRGGRGRHRLLKGWFSGTLRIAAVKSGIDSLGRTAVTAMVDRWIHG